jgi:hypothetical protein
VPTYDDNGWVVHPDVVHVPAAWNGYTYWMVYNTYNNEDQTEEKVHIAASNDGTTWVEPAGLTNPVTGSAGYQSDNDMILVGSTMYFLIRDASASPTKMELWKSTDGISWSRDSTLFTGTLNDFISPAVVWDGTQFVMFTVNGNAPTKIQRRTCATINGTWSDPVDVTGITASISHIDAWCKNGVYLLLIAGLSETLASSYNGDAWYQGPSILSKAASGWDSVGLYRATLQLVGSTMTMWYTGIDAVKWQFGKTTITGLTLP